MKGRTHSSVPRRRSRAPRRHEPGSYFFFSNPQVTHETHKPCPSLFLRATKAPNSRDAFAAIRSGGDEVFIKDAGILSCVLLAVAAMLTLSISAYGQQEVDPTWYNPWPEPTKAVSHHLQPGPAAKQEKGGKIAATANSRKKNSGPRDVHGPQRPKQVATTKVPSTR